MPRRRSVSRNSIRPTLSAFSPIPPFLAPAFGTDLSLPSHADRELALEPQQRGSSRALPAERRPRCPRRINVHVQ
jgi:hypothetical protein